MNDLVFELIVDLMNGDVQLVVNDSNHPNLKKDFFMIIQTEDIQQVPLAIRDTDASLSSREGARI